eukprot:TRINITY_DN45692_c0_g1_i1.p1 TRINITY_DN45692_c0_g1~~TRINITY_DN45692_c0_g1_i1.p1  ORF type:complete len:128 (-),score=37.65 TRINITY_DN45692_c0_g1_i1:36-419(-)
MCIRDRYMGISMSSFFNMFSGGKKEETKEVVEKEEYDVAEANNKQLREKIKILKAEIGSGEESLGIVRRQTKEIKDQELSLIHISEPTRPLYISYAVFCLKKKNKNKKNKDADIEHSSKHQHQPTPH